MNIAAWLNRLSLGQYEQIFNENDIDAEVLLELTAENLMGLRVSSIGHPRKLRASIAAFASSPQLQPGKQRQSLRRPPPNTAIATVLAAD